jgi:uncharacterized integral membrane protein
MNKYQPLTRVDALTVVLYRAGIFLSTLAVSVGSFLLLTGTGSALLFSGLLISLYLSVGLSVFFIHLYISRFKRALKRLYYISLAALAVLLLIGKGNVISALTSGAYGPPLLLLPLSGCLGFVAAKEAFCFRLHEGYALAFAMPLYLVGVSAGAWSAAYGLAAIALALAVFTLRKVFQPLHYDIGDKSAYR